MMTHITFFCDNVCDFYLVNLIILYMHFLQVLDEADRLLNEDFEKSLDEILNAIPRERNTYLFSATMTKKVRVLLLLHFKTSILVFCFWQIFCYRLIQHSPNKNVCC